MNILFRTDSSNKIGSGHLQRCINLANIFYKKGNKIFFICNNCYGNLNNLIKRNYPLKILSSTNKFNKNFKSLNMKDQIQDAKMTIDYAKKINADLIFLDSYLLDFNWQSLIRKFFKLIFVDDLALKNNCDIYINYHIEKKNIIQKNFLNKKTVKLLGMKNFIVNEKHLNFNNQSNIRKIYIYMGDVDSKNYSGKLFKLLLNKEFEKFQFIFILGSNYSLKDSFIKDCYDKKNITLIKKRLISIWNIFNMKKDIVICSGGLIASEALYLGVKSIFICQNNFQHKNLRLKNKMIYKDIKNIKKKKLLFNLNNLVKSKFSHNKINNSTLIDSILLNA